MKPKIFIDGSEGTTGLRIGERLKQRDDIELLVINPDLRKDSSERKKFIHQSDITILCLPDQAAREAVDMVESDHVTIIDASTAHRTEEGWAYGLPELSSEFRSAIRSKRRIAVPGCHATGFISLVYPLIASGILSKDYPISCWSLSGYSGAGKPMIAKYEDKDRSFLYDAPRAYALGQQHKHLKEMKAITGLSREPLFSPIICDYYSGMLVSVSFYSADLKGSPTPEAIHEIFTNHYKDQTLIQTAPFGQEVEQEGFLSAVACTGWDDMKIYVTGNKDRIMLSAHFDNLGKGASGAAVQCLNIILGCDEAKGLKI